MEMTQDIAAYVKESRKKRGWSQRRLAEEAGVTEQTVVNLERGHHGPTWKTVAKLTSALSR